MPEQPAELQRINWAACFPFIQLFRTFKMALHPGKLGLALAALLSIGLLGWLLDRLWPVRHQPVTDEVHAFWRTPDIDAWRNQRLDALPDVVRAAYQQEGFTLPEAVANDLKGRDRVAGAYRRAMDDFRKQGYDKLWKLKPEERAAAAARLNTTYRQLERFRHRGVFTAFLSYETSAVRQFIDSIATLNLTGRTREVLNARHGAGFAAFPLGDGPLGLTAAPTRLPGPDIAVSQSETGIGALGSLILMARGVQWLVLEHPWFSLLFLLGKLAILSFFGGAICRMAALNFARDERIPLRSALTFAARKYGGFFTAPLLPIGLILGLGVVLALGGLIGSIPFGGGTLAGLLLFLSLLAGLIMALVLIGLLAGGSLMWPTIAVESSDSFDAMSRSYSYVYSRPWRAAFYALVAAVYGAICYLFLRFFVWLVFRLARAFLGIGMAFTDRPGTGAPGARRIDALWPMPSFDDLLRSRPPFAAVNWDDTVGYWLSMLWLGLTVLLLCSFLVSFYLSASTIIYYLLRREVDATDLEDVYSEDIEEEEPARTTTPAAPAPAGESTPASGPETPPPQAGESPTRA